ncbi:MAG: PAS domain-containing sensor histidine kinase [Candidatus Cloacimonetes bacterium]|nr:PAS domain-containing sensor histidine kinase [Candidatus Cloacimonadota bacterium]MCF7812916.1 PAS domain-containing sensor histidine kinase [Candidatus Cloacimonadota bacterium]MCF7867128.1 PAS domain-containing sensor histidine kinase [Candidatus Cloacimonadota bacterium]MCF7882552.1 PAS domain-containing sensor histidine kinase [Candidatus Cloacimonadota bacterium]
MIEQINYFLQELIQLSKQEKDHLEFIKDFHQLLGKKLKAKETIVILRIDKYFLRSSFLNDNEEFWDIRTNDLNDEERFSRLADIALKEINYSYENDLLAKIQDNGFIIIKNTENNEKLEILEEIKDFFYLIFKSIYRQFQLIERVKELSCLHSISKIAEDHDLSIPDFLDQIVNLLPPAWQYPEITRAKIIFNDETFATKDFEESPINLRSNIMLQKRKVGYVEVNYPEDFKQKDSYPFLKEEAGLIRTIAQELSIILEKKKSEDESRKLEKQLLHADRLATLGQLSAGVAHEINEPLAGILGLAQLMEKNNSLDQQALNDLENIVSASLHAREVVKKLMLFARQVPSSQTDLNLNESVNNAVFFLESRCRKNMVKIHLDLKKSIPSINADSSQIHQVLINLIVNALQAMPDGGIINIKTYQNENTAFLECSDNGIGMTKDVLNQIFNPFFTTKKVNEGTGLGLSVVHGIIYSHGGDISVSSQPGKGAKFKISFPIGKGLLNNEE